VAVVTETDRGWGWRRWRLALVFCSFVSTMGIARAQELAPAVVSADAPVEIPGQAGSTQAAAAAPAQRDVSERTIFMNVLHDQKDLWLFPVRQLAHGHDWVPAVVVTGVTAGLVALDPHDDPYFRRTQSFGTFNRVFSGNITTSEILIAPASFYAVGLFDKNAYTRKTGLLAGEALADVTILELAMKGITRRLRPSDISPYGNFSDTFFKAKGDPLSSSFPSGHTISAFAVATVIAGRYGRRHRWVPFVAYGAAGLIGFSRVPLQAHFPSDVFLGAALGYAVARFDVLRGP
jgi:membrane-associated phospholipid phosphatase